MTGEHSGWAEALASGNGSVLVWGSLGFAVILVVVRWGCLPAGCRSPKKPLGEVNWSFTDSWASTVTAAGAVLGTILSTSGIIPDTAAPLSAGTLAGLNLLFAFIIVLAPLVFNAVARTGVPLPDDTGDGPRYQGYAGIFLLATMLTIWAVFGELATIAILLRELQPGALSKSLTPLFLVLLVASVATIGLYAWRTIKATITYAPPALRSLAPGITPPRPRWNLL